MGPHQQNSILDKDIMSLKTDKKGEQQRSPFFY